MLFKRSNVFAWMRAMVLAGLSSSGCYFLIGFMPSSSPGTTLPQKGLDEGGGTFSSRLPFFNWDGCRA
jgi:hypothetical protein